MLDAVRAADAQPGDGLRLVTIADDVDDRRLLHAWQVLLGTSIQGSWPASLDRVHQYVVERSPQGDPARAYLKTAVELACKDHCEPDALPPAFQLVWTPRKLEFRAGPAICGTSWATVGPPLAWGFELPVHERDKASFILVVRGRANGAPASLVTWDMVPYRLHVAAAGKLNLRKVLSYSLPREFAPGNGGARLMREHLLEAARARQIEDGDVLAPMIDAFQQGVHPRAIASTVARKVIDGLPKLETVSIDDEDNPLDPADSQAEASGAALDARITLERTAASAGVTPRELDVVMRHGRGETIATIASAYNVTPRRARAIRHRALEKLGVTKI